MHTVHAKKTRITSFLIGLMQKPFTWHVGMYW